MIGIIRDFLEIAAFLLLISFLYFIFIITIPIFRDPHGLLVMNELSDLSHSGFIKTLLFASAGACSLIGVLMIVWTPVFTPGVMANLWATTYFFTWIDTIFALSVNTQSLNFFSAFGIGIAFIYIFFLVLHSIGVQAPSPEGSSAWKSISIHYWIWGCMGFYLGLSGLLAFNSFRYDGLQLTLAFGAMMLCFLNYLLLLFLRKSYGKPIEKISLAGRFIFCVWSMGLLGAWIAQKWFS